MVIKYFVRAFKNTKRIFLRNSKYFREILILYVCFDEVASNNVMVLNRNKINMNRYDMSHIYYYIYIFLLSYFLSFLSFLMLHQVHHIHLLHTATASLL
jgi:hypothetical protein